MLRRQFLKLVALAPAAGIAAKGAEPAAVQPKDCVEICLTHPAAGTTIIRSGGMILYDTAGIERARFGTWVGR